MHPNHVCPVCSTAIPPDRQFHDTLICECGWTQSIGNESAEMKQSKQTGITIIAIAAFVVLSFIQTVNWDKHSLAIIPLKLSQWSDKASPEDLLQIVNICYERHKHDCVEQAYVDHFNLTEDIETLARLGHIQFIRGHEQAALETYNQYFTSGGKDMDARYEYAQTLGNSGQFKESQRQFRKVLKSKPGTLQFTVARKYVEMLISNDQHDSAKYIINFYRKRSKSSTSWMDKELKEMEKESDRQHASL